MYSVCIVASWFVIQAASHWKKNTKDCKLTMYWQLFCSQWSPRQGTYMIVQTHLGVNAAYITSMLIKMKFPVFLMVWEIKQSQFAQISLTLRTQNILLIHTLSLCAICVLWSYFFAQIPYLEPSSSILCHHQSAQETGVCDRVSLTDCSKYLSGTCHCSSNRV